MVAQVCDLEPGEFIWTGGDCHIYSNHIEQTKLQVSRTPLKLPTLDLDISIRDIDDFKFEHIRIVDYEHHPHISAPISV